MKNLLLTAAIALAATSIVTAQLYVKPTASGNESYIYAKDTQLYVKDNITLTENATSVDKKASIYLRGTAQLFQGYGVADNLNSGTGYISVFQQGTSDSYDYNDFSSPVSDPVGTGNTTFGYQRLHQSLGGNMLTNTDSQVAQLISGHFGFSSPLQIAKRWLFAFTAPSQNFYALNFTNALPSGQGFRMKGTDINLGQQQNYDFRGRPNSGDILVPLNASVSNGMAFDGGYSFSGNPYPSALDLNRVFYDPLNNGKLLQLEYYDEDRTINSHFHVDNKAGYGIWTPGPSNPDGIPGDGTYQFGFYTPAPFQNFDSAGNPTGTTGTFGPLVERRMAPIAQGFFFKSQPGTTGQNITIKNEHRRYFTEGDASQSEFRTPIGSGTIGGNTIDPIDPVAEYVDGQLRINTYFNQSHMRQTLLILGDWATDGYDNGSDGVSPMDATSEMYYPVFTPWDEVNPFPFVINAIPFDNPAKMVPITFELDQTTKVLLTGIEEINLPVDNVWVYDSLDHSYQEITGTEAASYYLPAGVYSNRFFLVFQQEVDGGLSTAASGNMQNAPINTNQLNRNVSAEKPVTFFQDNSIKQLQVSNPEGYNIKEASIFDMSGKLVLSKKNLGNDAKMAFETGNFSDGIYLVVLTTTENKLIDYKISVINK